MTTAIAPLQHPLEHKLEPVSSAALLPTFSGQQMAGALTAYRELQKALDAAMPEQIVEIRGRMFRKKGYWRAIRTAFNLSVECVKEQATEYGWLVVYRATAPNGRFADGDGACENDEKAEGQDTEHNVRSHAHTRAFNRAVSNLVGFGEVSAEEMTRTTQRPAFVTVTPTVTPDPKRPPAPAGYRYIDTAAKKSNGWYEVKFLEPSGGPAIYSTKQEQVGEIALQAFQQGVPVQVDGKPAKYPGEFYLNAVRTYKPEPTNAELDAEIVRQDEARRAGEIA